MENRPQDRLDQVDRYFGDCWLLPTKRSTPRFKRRIKKAGLPPIDVTALQGKFLEFLVRISGARRILEIGTLGGYSTIWLARALPEDGRIVSLELDPAPCGVARANLQMPAC
jgi:predicted O-methyltransferase YrrM